MRVYVVGSVNVDWVVYADRFPRPGETLLGTGFERHPGGKGANQAVAAARAGAEAVLVGAVGDDALGRFMRDTLAACGVDLRHLETVADSTGVALITVAGGENQIVVVPGANRRVDPARIAELDLRPGEVCLAQGETPVETVGAAFRRARSGQAITVFNPAPARQEAGPLFALTDVLVLNETESTFFAGTSVTRATDGEIRSTARALGLRPDQVLILTLGAGGAKALAGDRVIAVPGHPVDAVDSTGAGDCFCGYLATGLSRGDRIEEALRLANAAAALAVQVKGAVPGIPSLDRVERFLAGGAA